MKSTGIIFNQKNILVSGVVLTVFLIILVVVDISRRATPKTAAPLITTNQVAEGKPVIPQRTDQFRTEVPKDVVVPEMTTKPQELKDKSIVIPSLVAPAAPGAESKFRSFSLTADKGVFTPNKIIAKVGDTVRVTFTAVDRDYDIVFPNYNMMQQAKKGQTKILEFQALQEGNFLYYCDTCGGPNSSAKGNIIIVKS